MKKNNTYDLLLLLFLTLFYLPISATAGIVTTRLASYTLPDTYDGGGFTQLFNAVDPDCNFIVTCSSMPLLPSDSPLLLPLPLSIYVLAIKDETTESSLLSQLFRLSFSTPPVRLFHSLKGNNPVSTQQKDGYFLTSYEPHIQGTLALKDKWLADTDYTPMTLCLNPEHSTAYTLDFEEEVSCPLDGLKGQLTEICPYPNNRFVLGLPQSKELNWGSSARDYNDYVTATLKFHTRNPDPTIHRLTGVNKQVSKNIRKEYIRDYCTPDDFFLYSALKLIKIEQSRATLDMEAPSSVSDTPAFTPALDHKYVSGTYGLKVKSELTIERMQLSPCQKFLILSYHYVVKEQGLPETSVLAVCQSDLPAQHKEPPKDAFVTPPSLFESKTVIEGRIHSMRPTKNSLYIFLTNYYQNLLQQNRCKVHLVSIESGEIVTSLSLSALPAQLDISDDGRFMLIWNKEGFNIYELHAHLFEQPTRKRNDTDDSGFGSTDADIDTSTTKTMPPPKKHFLKKQKDVPENHLTRLHSEAMVIDDSYFLESPEGDPNQYFVVLSVNKATLYRLGEPDISMLHSPPENSKTTPTSRSTWIQRFLQKFPSATGF